MPEPTERPITVEEVAPFLTAEGLVHMQLALSKFHLAVARQENEHLRAAAGNGESPPLNRAARRARPKKAATPISSREN